MLNEQQAKQYFGWAPDSNMLGNYAHLLTEDTNNALLRLHNLVPTVGPPQTNVTACPTCRELNANAATHCVRCTQPLDLRVAYASATRERQKDEAFVRLASLLVNRGLGSEAVQIIQDAGLGPTLRAAAEAGGESKRDDSRPTEHQGL